MFKPRYLRKPNLCNTSEILSGSGFEILSDSNVVPTLLCRRHPIDFCKFDVITGNRYERQPQTAPIHESEFKYNSDMVAFESDTVE